MRRLYRVGPCGRVRLPRSAKSDTLQGIVTERFSVKYQTSITFQLYLAIRPFSVTRFTKTVKKILNASVASMAYSAPLHPNLQQ